MDKHQPRGFAYQAPRQWFGLQARRRPRLLLAALLTVVLVVASFGLPWYVLPRSPIT